MIWVYTVFLSPRTIDGYVRVCTSHANLQIVQNMATNALAIGIHTPDLCCPLHMQAACLLADKLCCGRLVLYMSKPKDLVHDTVCTELNIHHHIVHTNGKLQPSMLGIMSSHLASCNWEVIAALKYQMYPLVQIYTPLPDLWGNLQLIHTNL